MDKENKNIRRWSQRGSILIFSVIILTIILTITFAVLGILIPKIRIATEPLRSVNALYAADSASEWCLYNNRKSPMQPVASYALNESSGTTTADYSGNNFTGTLQNGAAFFTAKNGNGILLDRFNDLIDLGSPALLNITSSLSVSAWVNEYDFNEQGQSIVHKSNGNGWQFGTMRDGAFYNRRFSFRVVGSGGTAQRVSQTIFLQNIWYHVTGVFNPTARTLDIYVNGILDNGALTGTIPSSITNELISTKISGNIPSANSFGGRIDDVRIYKDVISQAILQSDMITPVTNISSSIPPPIPKPVMSNGSSYKVYSPIVGFNSSSCREGWIDHRAVGTYLGVSRSLEVGYGSLPPPAPVSPPNPNFIGQIQILNGNDSGNGNLLIAQEAYLGYTGTLQSLSFYVVTAAGNLRLGIYNSTGPGAGPGAKLAETNSFVPVVGWNTVNVITPVVLIPGKYWLAYLPSSSTLAFRQINIGNYALYSYAFGPMPATFSTTPAYGISHWSFYGTLTP